MKSKVNILCAILMIIFLSATAQSTQQDDRFLLETHQLAIQSQGAIVVASHLIKFDTATGEIWRYEREKWDDKTQQSLSACFASIPVEKIAGEGQVPGRYRLVVISGGKAEQPFPDLLIIDSVTGMTWVYRGTSQKKDGITVLGEAFLLIKNSNQKK